jgi:hypothetical protein
LVAGSKRFIGRRLRGLRVVALVATSISACAQTPAPPDSVPLVDTGFEASESYIANVDLAGQNGWIGYGLGGNGVLADPLPGFSGQYAYIGYNAPPNAPETFNIWKPVSLAAVGAGPIVQFNVRLEISDSTSFAPFFDDFRWSVYNADEHRLFSIDFDNKSRTVNYVLEGDTNGTAAFHSTGWTFTNNRPYSLVVWIDLNRNLWSANINDIRIVTNQPVTAQQAALTLGDIDAVWVVRTPGSPGDNYMLFDDYRIDATPLDAIPPLVEWQGFGPDKRYASLRIHGEPGVIVELQASEDLQSWATIAAAVVPADGSPVNFRDPDADPAGVRFYRAVSAPGHTLPRH